MSPNPDSNFEIEDDEMKPQYDFSKGLRGIHAARFSKLTSDEAFVLGYWQEEGFDISAFSDKELKAGKAPDFQLRKNGREVAFCEVKSFQRDEWLERQLRQAESGAEVGGLRADPIFNRISNAIRTAFKQFESVNPAHQLLNFLFLVNHDTSAKSEDLDRVLTGYESPRLGTLEPTSVQYSVDRIRSEKGKIDLYVWLDLGEGGQIRSQAYRVLGNAESRQWVCGLLGIEPSTVKNIPTAA